MNSLRIKGSSLPIKISFKIKIENNEPSIQYYLDKFKIEFKEIRYFLFNAKTIFNKKI